MARITNVKISFKLANCTYQFLKSIPAKFNNVSKTFPSFFVWRAHGYVYVIFFTGHVNVTSIQGLNRVPDAIYCLLTDFKLDVTPFPKWTCDNITADGYINLKQKLDLSDVCRKLRNSETFAKIRFNTQRFPGCFIKTIYGTILFFNSGKYVLVGIKSTQAIYALEQLFISEICAIINANEFL